MAGGSKIIKERGTLVEGIRLHKCRLRDLHYFAKSYKFDLEEKKALEDLRTKQAKTLELDISRLLYTNSDVSRQEKFLILFILNASSLLKTDNIFEDKPNIQFDGDHDRIREYFKNVEPSSKTPSDMADSGLETGSSLFGTQETSPSENSGTDLEESNAVSSATEESSVSNGDSARAKHNGETHTEAGAYDNNIERSTSKKKSQGKKNFHKIKSDDISDYEAKVLSEAFDELSDENENGHDCNNAKNNAASIFLKCSNYSKKSRSNSKEDLDEPEVTEEEVKNYYFIDASSLNDDLEVIAPDPAEFAQELNAKLSNEVAEMDSYGQEDSLTSTRESSMNPEIQVMDSASCADEEELSLHKSSNKESLIVEIKETDSGESNSHSPCPDNTDATTVCNDKNASNICSDNEDADKPRLVRRNTFEFEADDEKLALLRQEYERQQEISNQDDDNNSKNCDSAEDSHSNLTSDTETKIPSEEKHQDADILSSVPRCSSDKYLAFSTKYNESSAEDVDDNSCTSLPVAPAPVQPMARRKSDSCPIRPTKPLQLSSSLTAWVVDMSDCSKKDAPTQKVAPVLQTHRRHQSFAAASSKQYCEFFVDLSDNSLVSQEREAKSTSDVDKKNIFSMFIEFENKSNTSGTSSKLAEKRLELQSRLSHKPKSPFPSELGNSESPVVRRRTMSNSRLQPFKRHSWNTDKTSSCESSTIEAKTPDKEHQVTGNKAVPRYEHKRAHSLSVERPTGDFRKFLGIKLTQSMTTSDQTRVAKDGEYDFRDTPPNSHVEIINEELMISAKKHNLNQQEINKSQQDDSSEHSNVNKTVMESPDVPTRKSETFNISTSSTAVSSGSDSNDFQIPDLTFDRKSKLQNSAENNLETPEMPKSVSERLKKSENEFNKYSKKYSQPNGTHHPLEKPSKIAKSVESGRSLSGFVKLSDLDKVSVKSQSSSSSSMKDEKISRLGGSSTKPQAKSRSKLVSNTGFKSFTRKFPGNAHPTSLSSKKKTTDTSDDQTGDGDVENVVSESDISSVHSSMGRSGNGSTEETETSTSFAIGKPHNRLGEDLLRMFIEQVNTDVIIDVSGQQIRAHKCILSSRCQYFAAILSGGWIESSGNLISLQGYSFNSVHFALCHIYSGESYIPDSIDIVELASLADMLCLEGLKEVIGFTLKVKYCHLFHKPCNVCTVGVIGCMPLAAACGLDEVYRKSLRWIMRHFVRIWPSKEFATLPRELMDKCYQQHIIYMSPDNVLQTIMDCNKLLATIPNVRWAEPVFQLGSNLLDASMKYLTDHFAGVLTSEQLQRIGFDQTWNVSRLEDHLMAAADRLGPEQACRSYSTLHKMLSSSSTDSYRKIKTSALLTELLTKIHGRVEKCLIREAARAARTSSWLKMDLELRRKIQELACLVIVPTETPKARPSRHSNFLKDAKDTLQETTKVLSDRSNVTRNLDLRRVKAAITEYAEKPNKPTPLLQTRKVMNKPKSDPLERKSKSIDAIVKPISDNKLQQPRPWLNKNEVKSRYLEPRIRPVPKDSPNSNDKVIVQQRKKIMISSSDSSRTSSPATRRATEKKPLVRTKLTISKDGNRAHHSSDSLSDNLAGKAQSTSKSLGVTRPESPRQRSLKTASSDSVATEISTSSVVKSPSMSRVTSQAQKIASPTSLSTVRRPARSLESSTAASRSRAAASLSIYHPSTPSLRKNLLEAAKTPDIPSKTSSSFMPRASFRQSTRSKKEGSANSKAAEKTTKKDTTTKSTGKAEKINSKVKSETPPERPKFLVKRSRSNTFSKDEPSVMDKSDLMAAEINV